MIFPPNSVTCLDLYTVVPLLVQRKDEAQKTTFGFMFGQRQEVNAGCACAHPKERHVVRVAAKRSNRRLDPSQGLDLVFQPVISGQVS